MAAMEHEYSCEWIENRLADFLADKHPKLAALIDFVIANGETPAEVEAGVRERGASELMACMVRVRAERAKRQQIASKQEAVLDAWVSEPYELEEWR